jgi:hypothetical protein
MTRNDVKWWLAAWGGVVLLAATVYLAAWRAPLPGYRFCGFLLNSDDAWGYQAFARAFARGGLLIDNPWSNRVLPPAFFNLLWFLLGKGMAATGLPFIALYYAAGVVSAGLMYLAILGVMKAFLGDGFAGRTGFLLAGFGGGLGWIVVLLSTTAAVELRPLDIFHQEGYPLQAALFFPHLALSTAMLAAIMLLLWRGLAQGRRGALRWAGALLIGLGFFHPYHLVTVLTVAGAWSVVRLIRDRGGWLGRLRDFLPLAGGVALPLLYYRWLFTRENFAWWAKANEVLTGGVVPVLLGLGALLPLAAIGAWGRDADSAHPPDRRLFLSVWAMAQGALLFAHPLVRFEAKLAEGLILPLAALAVLGATDLASRFPRLLGGWRGWGAAALAGMLLLPSHAILVRESLASIGVLRSALLPGNWPWRNSLPARELEAHEFVRRTVPADAVFLGMVYSNILPAVADVRCFSGKMHITPDEFRKRDETEWFFSSPLSDFDRYRFLRERNIGYLWADPWSMVAFPFRPEEMNFLERIFDNGTVRVYRVR